MRLFSAFNTIDTTTAITVDSLPATRQETSPVAVAPSLPAMLAGDAAAALPDSIRAIRDERWQFCRAVVDLCRASGRSLEECAQIVAARDAANYRHLSPAKLTYHNVRRWLGRLGTVRTRDGRDYRWDNVQALADRYVRGRQPARINPLAWQVFTAMYLNVRKPTINSAYRQTKALFLREFPEVEFPTLDQLTYQLKRLPQNVIDAGREGIDYVVNHSLYMIIRDWSAVVANQCWFADSRPFDQLIRIPDDKAPNGWRAVRPNVMYMMDAASWYCVGFEVSAGGVDNNLIRNAFARACMTHGRPGVLYIDNGSDYNKLGFTQPVTIGGREYSILQALDVHLTNARPYNGRAKTVERRFQFFSTDFDRRQPSYLGDSPGHRPDTAELYYAGEALMTLPTEYEFVQMLQSEIDKFHATPLGGHLKGKTPNEAFAAANRMARAPMSAEEMYLALLLPLPTPRKVHRGGCLDINRVRYYAPELAALTGTNVIVKTSYLEPGAVHAYDLDGNYLCPCTAQAMTHPLANLYGDADDKAQLEQQLVIQGRQQRMLMEQLRNTTGNLAGLAISDLMALTRAEIEDGTRLITVGAKAKVKAGTHALRAVTTPARAAEARRELAAAGQPVAPVAPPLSAAEERELAAAHTAITSRLRSQGDDDDTDIAAAHQFLTNRNNQGDQDDEY